MQNKYSLQVSGKERVKNGRLKDKTEIVHVYCPFWVWLLFFFFGGWGGVLLFNYLPGVNSISLFFSVLF